MEINQNLLRITGSACLSGRIDTNRVIQINSAELSCYSSETRDNQDGTFDIIYKCKITSGVDLEQGGEIIRGADKTSQSKKTRYCIKELGYELGEGEDFYETFQQKLRGNIHEVWQLLKNH